MTAKIVRNQKDLTPSIPGQASHELDQEPGIHGIPRPRGKGRFQPVRRLVDQNLLNRCSLIRRKRSSPPPIHSATSSAELDRLAALFHAALPYPTVTTTFTNSDALNNHLIQKTPFPQTSNLRPALLLRLWTMFARTDFSCRPFIAN